MTNKRLALRKLLPGFLRDKRGGVMIYTGLALPVLLGFSGLSVDVGSWYLERRTAQQAADHAALGGALEEVDMSTRSEHIVAKANFDPAVRWYWLIHGSIVLCLTIVGIP